MEMNPMNDKSAIMEDYQDEIGGGEKENMSLPGGLTKIIRSRVEVPKQLLERTLMQGEEVTGQFDFFYLENKMDRQLKLALNCMTLGLFSFILTLLAIYRYVRDHLCCAFCKDRVYNKRGKLSITSFGRVIFWEQELSTYKGSVDQRAHFEITHATRITNIHELKQMKIKYQDHGLIIDYCCKAFNIGLECTFFSYNTADANESCFIHTASAENFLNTIATFIKDAFLGNAKAKRNEPLTILLVANPHDKEGTDYKPPSGQESLEEIMALTEAMLVHLGKTKDAFLPPSMFGSLDGANAAFKNPVVSGIKEIWEDLNGFKILDEADENKVTLPVKWFPLIPGEEMVAVLGQNYLPSGWEIFLCCVTFGAYYYAKLRAKSWENSAVILTTKRIIEVVVIQPKGRVPVSLHNCKVNTRSYFPGDDILSGFMRGTPTRIVASVVSSSGQISVTMPTSHIGFAQKMMLASTRQTPIRSASELMGMLPPKYQSAAGNDQVLNNIDQRLLPLIAGEEALYRFESGSISAPCCPLTAPCCLGTCAESNWPDSKPQWYMCYFTVPQPFLDVLWTIAKVLTLGNRPIQRSCDAILTTNSIFYVSTDGIGGCCDTRETVPFFITWVPVRKFTGQSSTIYSYGAHPFAPCLCGMCCTLPEDLGDSTYDLTMYTDSGFKIPLKDSVPYKNWIKEDEYIKMGLMLGALQTAQTMGDRV